MLLSEEMLLDDFHVDQMQYNSEMEVKCKFENVKTLSQEAYDSVENDLDLGTVDFATELNSATDDDFSEVAGTISQSKREYEIYIKDETRESDGIVSMQVMTLCKVCSQFEFSTGY